MGGEFGVGARPGPNPPMALLGHLCQSSGAGIASYIAGQSTIPAQRAIAAAARLTERRALGALHEIETLELYYSAAAAHKAHARSGYASALARDQPAVQEARDGQCGHRTCFHGAQIPPSAVAAPPALPARRDRHLRWHLLDDRRPRSSSDWSFPTPSERLFTCHPPPQARLSVVSVGRARLRSCLPKQACFSSRSSRGLKSSTLAPRAPQTRATALTSKPDQLPFISLRCPRSSARTWRLLAVAQSTPRPARRCSPPSHRGQRHLSVLPMSTRLYVAPWRHACAVSRPPHGLAS